MEQTYRLKVKIGDHEFEAEGPQDSVERQFEAFKELVSMAPSTTGHPFEAMRISKNPGETLNEGFREIEENYELDLIKRVFNIQGNSVSLTVLPRTDARDSDAALIVLLGHTICLSSPSVSGAQIIGDLKQSGISVTRVDRILRPYVDGNSPFVIVTGIKRGSRYKLTNQGMARARTLAKELADMIPP